MFFIIQELTLKVMVGYSFQLEHLYLGDRQSLDAARSELAAVQVRNEKQLVKVWETVLSSR